LNAAPTSRRNSAEISQEGKQRQLRHTLPGMPTMNRLILDIIAKSALILSTTTDAGL
jgi:hypothetical protein